MGTIDYWQQIVNHGFRHHITGKLVFSRYLHIFVVYLILINIGLSSITLFFSMTVIYYCINKIELLQYDIYFWSKKNRFLHNWCMFLHCPVLNITSFNHILSGLQICSILLHSFSILYALMFWFLCGNFFYTQL